MNSIGIKSKPLVSIIIPVYGTEKYLPKCLDSIINQTYRHLEVIVVNDCSPGDTKSIVDSYMLEDNRIKYVEHKENKGLFHARLTGSDHATGEYIAFVDSDDYISIDYYRLLVDKAVTEDADIVEGRIIRENERGNKFIQNNNNILFERLIGDEIRDEFFSQEGMFYHWHVIWNKIYRRSLWEKCKVYYKKQTKHLIMTEDLVFSSILFCNASKYCSIPYDGYFYSIRSDASTGSGSNTKKFIKNFTDMATAFDFVESYLKENEFDEKYVTNLLNWKKRYFRLWANRIKNDFSSYSTQKHLLDVLKEKLKINEIEPVQPEDYFHGTINTPWEHRYETLKRMIADPKYKVISFDVFDTLIVRPFLDPRDILQLLDDYFHEILPQNKMVEFSSIRLQTEERMRALIKISNPFWQDVTLDEIYEYIQKEYDFPPDLIEKLKSKEVELEKKYIDKRESTYQLFVMAKEIGKKVILVSDMYLPSSIIEEILLGVGYSGYDKIYVSSETRVLKHTGDMYQYVLKDQGISSDEILHIGDNWESDVIMAKRQGIDSYFIPKTTDLLMNTLGDKETGNSIKYFRRNINWSTLEFPSYFSTRCMLAVVANKLFDHPYPTFNKESDFNIDPYAIGYYALGMHTFGLVHWIINDAVKKNKNAIHFMARDGYLPYNSYKIMAKYIPNAPIARYIYASRRSLLSIMLREHNRYGLDSFISYQAHSPETILELFKEILKDTFDSSNLERKGIILTKKFSSKFEFKSFIDILVKECIDQSKLDEYIKMAQEYFSSIGHNDATFDLGYSARLQTLINDITGRPCSVYFVHTNGEIPWSYSRRNKYELNSFYDMKPIISGILREHFFAELGPSCIGYSRDNNGNVVPIFESYVCKNKINEIMIKRMHQGCLDFIEDVMRTFKEIVPKMKIRSLEVSIPLEMYIHNSKPSDRTVLSHSYSDDFVHAGNLENSILTWWNNELSKIANCDIGIQITSQSTGFLYNHSRVKKVIYYALFDRDTLKRKVKDRYKNKKIAYKLLTVSYRMLRKIKRTIKR